MSKSFMHVRENELDIGLAFAEDKYGIRLNRQVLKMLFNATGKKALEIGGRYAFDQARRSILSSELEQKTKEQRERFVAYGSAISKIGNERSIHARRRRAVTAQRKKKREPASPKQFLFLREGSSQYTFV